MLAKLQYHVIFGAYFSHIEKLCSLKKWHLKSTFNVNIEANLGLLIEDSWCSIFINEFIYIYHYQFPA